MTSQPPFGDPQPPEPTGDHSGKQTEPTPPWAANPLPFDAQPPPLQPPLVTPAPTPVDVPVQPSATKDPHARAGWFRLGVFFALVGWCAVVVGITLFFGSLFDALVELDVEILVERMAPIVLTMWSGEFLLMLGGCLAMTLSHKSDAPHIARWLIPATIANFLLVIFGIVLVNNGVSVRDVSHEIPRTVFNVTQTINGLSVFAWFWTMRLAGHTFGSPATRGLAVQGFVAALLVAGSLVVLDVMQKSGSSDARATVIIFMTVALPGLITVYTAGIATSLALLVACRRGAHSSTKPARAIGTWVWFGVGWACSLALIAGGVWFFMGPMPLDEEFATEFRASYACDEPDETNAYWVYRDVPLDEDFTYWREFDSFARSWQTSLGVRGRPSGASAAHDLRSHDGLMDAWQRALACPVARGDVDFEASSYDFEPIPAVVGMVQMRLMADVGDVDRFATAVADVRHLIVTFATTSEIVDGGIACEATRSLIRALAIHLATCRDDLTVEHLSALDAEMTTLAEAFPRALESAALAVSREPVDYEAEAAEMEFPENEMVRSLKSRARRIRQLVMLEYLRQAKMPNVEWLQSVYRPADAGTEVDPIDKAWESMSRVEQIRFGALARVILEVMTAPYELFHAKLRVVLSHIRMMRVALAIERHIRDQGRPPASLSELDCDPAMLIDDWDGEGNFVYMVIDDRGFSMDGYWIGSIGVDSSWDGFYRGESSEDDPRLLIPPVFD